jgi:hypothetical protein
LEAKTMFYVNLLIASLLLGYPKVGVPIALVYFGIAIYRMMSR